VNLNFRKVALFLQEVDGVVVVCASITRTHAPSISRTAGPYILPTVGKVT
jgi:hypothetical protein